MYDLIEYSNNYSKTSGNLWHYYRDEQDLNNAGVIIDFTYDTDSASFKFKSKITGQTGNNVTKGVQMIVPLTYLWHFWRILEIPLINCKINPILISCANYFIMAGTFNNQETRFLITDTRLYVPVVTLSTQDNAKLLQHLKWSFIRTINWKKYQSKATTQARDRYLDYLIISL